MRRFLETNSKASPGVRLSRRQARAFFPSARPFRSGCLRSGRTAFEGRVLLPAWGRRFDKRVQRTNSLKRQPIRLARSQRPQPSFLGQRFSSRDSYSASRVSSVTFHEP